MDAADHETAARRRRKGLRSRGRALVAGTAAVVVIGAGIGIVATAGDDEPAARVTSAQEGVADGSVTSTDASTASTTPTTVPAAGDGTTIPGTTVPGTTSPVSVAPTAVPVTAAAPTAAPAGPAAGECPAGAWDLTPESGLAVVTSTMVGEGLDGTVSYVSGVMRVSLGADGSWSTAFEAWAWGMDVPDLGFVTLTFDGSSSGTATVHEATGTIDIDEDFSAVTMTLGGPMAMTIPADGSFAGTASYTCTGDTMSMIVGSSPAPYVFERAA